MEDCALDALVSRSVGWLLHDTDQYNVIIPHMIQPGEDARIAAQGRGDMTIPCAAIVKLSELADPTCQASASVRG